MTKEIKFEVTAAAGIIMYIDEEISSISDYTAEELTGRSIWNFYKNMAMREHLLFQLSQEKTLKNYPTSFLNKNGGLSDYILNMTLEYRNDKPYRIKGTIRKLLP